jgi:hypothetical protein
MQARVVTFCRVQGGVCVELARKFWNHSEFFVLSLVKGPMGPILDGEVQIGECFWEVGSFLMNDLNTDGSIQFTRVK